MGYAIGLSGTMWRFGLIQSALVDDGSWCAAPRRAGRAFSWATYRGQNVVERCVGRLKENRRVATRYDECAVNFLAFVTLAFIRRYLRLLDPTDTA